MSMGSPIRTIRITETEGEMIQEAIDKRNGYSTDTPWTFSDFVRKAIAEKLSHMQRSRRPRNRHPKEEPYAG